MVRIAKICCLLQFFLTQALIPYFTNSNDAIFIIQVCRTVRTVLQEMKSLFYTKTPEKINTNVFDFNNLDI